jgi:indolepyruvate ferredoxin oxidoreductase alpha subunit
VNKLYVVVEVEPYIEDFLKQNGIKAEGKAVLPLVDELTPDIIREALSAGRGAQSEIRNPKSGIPVPPRPPQLCAECGHRGVFKVLSELKLTVMGDIGCYTLGALPPFSALHTCIDMGSAISHAYGYEKAGEPASSVVSVIGDSTFMHSGITALANMVYNKGNTLTIILDNRTTAMTGRQPHAAAGNHLTMGVTSNIDIEKLIKGMGIEAVAVIDPFKGKELKNLIEEYLEKTGVRVIIARRKCALLS